MPPQPASAIAVLTVDCSDAKAMVRFYTDAFGGRADPDFPNVDGARVDGLLILFRELGGWTPPAWLDRTSGCISRSLSRTYSKQRPDSCG